MNCPTCQHENIAGAKFCQGCGVPLGRNCVNCGSEVASTSRFCSQCGHRLQTADDFRFASAKNYPPQHFVNKILASRRDLEGERKHVTVLFADIRGSMELLVGRDAETAEKLLFEPVLECMIEAVHRYEGTVHRVMGDGIMALFGAPLAVEDHAVRACYAGLRMQETVARYAAEIQRSHGVQLAIRVGVNSGEIVIRTIGSDLDMDFTVVGQTVHLANRIEQMAKPGSVLTTADTFRLAEGYVAAEPLGPIPVKGLSDPVQIYEVTGAGAARTRLQVAAGRGLMPFVGRDVELAELLGAQRLAGHGHGQVVAVAGEAGVGKSRLVHEFLHSPHMADWVVLKSSSASYGGATPYLPIIELLRDYFEINVNDSIQSVREKISKKILTLDPALQDSLPPLLDLLDALDDDHPFRSLDPLQHRRYTYEAVTSLLLRESRVQPVVAVVEDLHWIDTLTLGLLDELVVGAQKAPLLLIVTYRPEYRGEWRNRPNHHQLRLNPLASDSLGELLQALLGSDPSLPALKKFLVDHTNGNPFFLEEIVRALVDTGVLEGRPGNYGLARPFLSIEVPPTVRAVLAARIDALAPFEKRLLEQAAVIGRDVPFGLLQAISGFTEQRVRGLLDNLQAAEFLYATQIFPDLQYTFKHSLTHEVAYSGVLHEHRRHVHARVVDAIETLYGERLGEQVERLAHHAVRGALPEKAVHYLRQAGWRAAARSALSDARAWFEQALEILQALPENEATLAEAYDIRLELRRVLRQLGEARQMLEHLREAEVLAERLQDDRRRGQVCALMTTVQVSLDALDEALAAGTGALEIAERLGDLELRILSATCLVQAYYYRGQYERVVEVGTDSLAALPADRIHEYFGLTVPASVFGRAYLIMSLAELGRFAEAASYKAEAIQIAESKQHVFTVGWAYFAASMLHLIKGDWANAHSRIKHWNAVLRTGNVAIHLPWAVAASARVLAQIGKASEALDRIREGEQLLEHQAAQGSVVHRSWTYGTLGRACLLLGRIDEGWRLGHRAAEVSRHQPGCAAYALHLLGDIANHPDCFDAEGGAHHYREALAIARLQGMRPLVAHCHLGLGKLYRRVGKTEHAGANFAVATRMYRQMEMSSWLEQETI